jgi:hypothetical protein
MISGPAGPSPIKINTAAGRAPIPGRMDHISGLLRKRIRQIVRPLRSLVLRSVMA